MGGHVSTGTKICLILLVGGLLISAIALLQIGLEKRPSPTPPFVGNTLKTSLCKLSLSLGNLSCPSNKSIFASLLDHEPKLGPQQCHCPGTTRTLAGSWNNCISCLYVTFMGIHNGFAREFQEYLVAGAELNSTIAFDDVPISIRSTKSKLKGFSDYAEISNERTGDLCMSLHRTQHKDDPKRMKAILHLNSESCPKDGSLGSHAMAMKLDIGYSNPKEQFAEFFHTGEYEGNGFSISGSDSDDIFYMRLKVQEMQERNQTTAWAYRLSQNKGWKYFIQGEDDVLFYVANKFNSKIQDKRRGFTGMSAQCVDDKLDKEIHFKQCLQEGFRFSEFPISLHSINKKTYPTWNREHISVNEARAVQDYFP